MTQKVHSQMKEPSAENRSEEKSTHSLGRSTLLHEGAGSNKKTAISLAVLFTVSNPLSPSLPHIQMEILQGFFCNTILIKRLKCQHSVREGKKKR